MSDIKIATITSRGFEENGYLVWREGLATAIAIDPGADSKAFLDRLAHEGLSLEAIVLTHAHVDHLEGVPRLAAATGAPVHLHPGDRPLYERARDQAAMFGMRIESMPALSGELSDGQVLDLASLQMEVRHVPGHSPGHVILVVQGEAVAFVGDVIFQGSIGRTDLWGGDFATLVAGIRQRVFDLDDEVRLYSGHGSPTTVGHERATNPFLVPSYGGGLA